MPIIFLAVVLKIPVFFGLWLVWWAVKESRSSRTCPARRDDHGFRRWRRSPSSRAAPAGAHTAARPRRSRTARRAAARRTPVIEPRLAPGMAAHERREHTPGRQRGADHDNQTGGTTWGQPVVHFEVVGKDIDKLKGFYSEL